MKIDDMMMKKEDEYSRRTRLLLCIHQALLGEITPNMRAVHINWDDENVELFFIFDGEISEEDEERASCIETKMISSFLQPWDNSNFAFQCIRIDSPQPIQCDSKECVFLRKE